MYTPKFEKPLSPAALRANMAYYLAKQEQAAKEASLMMARARRCAEQLAAAVHTEILLSK